MNAIQPIETEYAGCLFRSRLEARWAVFFDALDITWEHEPEGFETSAGRYLPDFRIRIPQTKDYGQHFQWFEVKPQDAPLDARHKALASESGKPLIVARGMPRGYEDQMRASKHSNRLESPLMAYGIEREAWPVAFCDSTATWQNAHYCSLGDNRHWCQEAMDRTLEGYAKCHLALYGRHEGDEFGEGYTTYPPSAAHDVDRAYAKARSARFGT